jgi:hypothetical protein
VVGPVTTMPDIDRDPHRPNQSAPIAMKVFRKLVKNKDDVWLPSDIDSKWCQECLKAGISTSTVRAHQTKSFVRARNHLIEERQLERRADDGCCRLFPPIPSEEDFGQAAHQRRAAADRGEHRQAAGDSCAKREPAWNAAVSNRRPSELTLTAPYVELLHDRFASNHARDAQSVERVLIRSAQGAIRCRNCGHDSPRLWNALSDLGAM